MQVRLIRARHGQEVGDVSEVPDGAEVSELYYEVIDPPPPPPEKQDPPKVPATGETPKAGA